MNLINFLFALLKKHTPSESMDANEFANLYQEAQTWDMKQAETSDNKLTKLYAKYSRLWYVKVILMILYIPVNIWLTRMTDPAYILGRDYEDESGQGMRYNQ